LATIGAGSEFRISHRGVHRARLTCCRRWVHVRVVARAWLFIFYLRVFTVGHFRNENACIDHGVEGLRLACLLNVFVLARSRVVTRRIKLVLDVDRRLENLSILLR